MKNKTQITNNPAISSNGMLALGFWRNLKCYLELPFISKWRRKEKITHIPICLGLTVSWSNYNFELCDTEEYFPRGRKGGKHRLTISCGVFYWWIRLTFYSPKTLS